MVRRTIRLMRLCLSIEIQEGMSYAETLRMTRAGEELGYEAALLAEHYYPTGRLDLYGDRKSTRLNSSH